MAPAGVAAAADVASELHLAQPFRLAQPPAAPYEGAGRRLLRKKKNQNDEAPVWGFTYTPSPGSRPAPPHPLTALHRLPWLSGAEPAGKKDTPAASPDAVSTTVASETESGDAPAPVPRGAVRSAPGKAGKGSSGTDDADDRSAGSKGDAAGTEPKASTDKKSTSKSGGKCEDGCEPWWGICGGKGYAGPGCCFAGSNCIKQDSHYALCIPMHGSSGAGGGGECKVAYQQCGGEGMDGEECCAEGLECVASSDTWSMCTPLCSA